MLPGFIEPLTIEPIGQPIRLTMIYDFPKEDLGDSDCVMTVPVRFLGKKELLFSRLEEFSCLEEGWDGSDGIVPYSESISNCKKFMHRLPDDIIEKIELDDVYPTGHGTMVVDLMNEKNEKVSIEFGITKMGFYTDFNDSHNYSSDGIRVNYNLLPSDLISAVTKLYQSYIF